MLVLNLGLLFKSIQAVVGHRSHTKMNADGLWKACENYISGKTTRVITVEGKNVITCFQYNNKNLRTFFNLFILLGKYHIHKAKYSKSTTSFELFSILTDLYFQSLKLVTYNKSVSITSNYS